MSWENAYAGQVLSPEVKVTPEDRRPSVGDPKRFDLETFLPLELIRVHTKTEDVPSVSDDQLALYREAAVESAEHYTGMMLRGSKQQIESIDFTPTRRDRMKGHRRYTTQYPVADGIVYIFGSRNPIDNRTIRVTPGTRVFNIPITHVALDASSCCNPNPCHQEGDWGLQIMYRAGFTDCDNIPAGIKLGMLKHIAWNITHPGDKPTTLRNTSIDQASGSAGSMNNVAWASGALELWREYPVDAI